jgi:hypothetical protein
VRHQLKVESKAVEAEASGGMMDGEWGVREPIAVFRARSKPRNQNESLDIQRSLSAGALDDHDSFLGPTPGIISRNLSMDSLSADICFAGKTLNPRPSTLDSRPSTLSPQPSTLNPQPSTLNPNPQPSTLYPQKWWQAFSSEGLPSTFNPKLQTLHPKPQGASP